MEVTGIIQEVFEPQYGTSKAGMDWAKREFLIVTQGQYPKHILFTISGKDRVQQFIPPHVVADMYEAGQIE